MDIAPGRFVSAAFTKRIAIAQWKHIHNACVRMSAKKLIAASTWELKGDGLDMLLHRHFVTQHEYDYMNACSMCACCGYVCALNQSLDTSGCEYCPLVPCMFLEAPYYRWVENSHYMYIQRKGFATDAEYKPDNTFATDAEYKRIQVSLIEAIIKQLENWDTTGKDVSQICCHMETGGYQ